MYAPLMSFFSQKLRTELVLACAMMLMVTSSAPQIATAKDKDVEADTVSLKFRRLQKLRERQEKRNESQDEGDDPGVKEPYPSYPASSRTYTLKLENPSKDQVLNVVNQAIQATSPRHLVAGAHTPWQIFHGILAGRDNFKVRVGNKYMPAIDWLSTANPVYQGKHLFEVTQHGGRTHPYVEPYLFEGHPNQFLGILTMSNLPKTHTFVANTGQKITIEDIISNAKKEVNSREEITWTLWFLSHYLEPDAEWYNADGEFWSIEKLVQIQTRANVRTAACGGTHGLFALAFARNNYMRRANQPLRGVWLEADQKLQRYTAEAKAIQKSNGSFPTKYFQGYGEPEDFEDRIKSSGHMMEWLMISVSDEELKQPWVRRGIYYVAYQILANRNAQADTGPLYHALDALVLFRDRMKYASPSESTPETEEKPQQLARPEPRPETSQPKTRTAIRNIFKGISASPEMVVTEEKVDPGKAAEEVMPQAPLVPEEIEEKEAVSRREERKERRAEEKQDKQQRKQKDDDGWRKAKKIYETSTSNETVPAKLPAKKKEKEEFELPII